MHQNLTKMYKGGRTAVSKLDLTEEAGDIYGFIGHNGAGKTTTIKCVVGIHDFEEGEITIDGISVKEDPIQCKSMLAYIQDNPDLYDYLTGIQYLNFMADIFDLSAAEREERIKKEADAFEITATLMAVLSRYFRQICTALNASACSDGGAHADNLLCGFYGGKTVVDHADASGVCV